jgi:hypothetical protein
MDEAVSGLPRPGGDADDFYRIEEGEGGVAWAVSAKGACQLDQPLHQAGVDLDGQHASGELLDDWMTG